MHLKYMTYNRRMNNFKIDQIIIFCLFVNKPFMFAKFFKNLEKKNE